MANLGRLEKVDLRTGWKNEAGDFTPWLAQDENLKLLGETLGMDLVLVGQEQGVGQFRADIVCRDVASSSTVLIENQLEPTDHNHLGQILTYAAGLEAVSIIWVARKFIDQHRAALDWLNEHTDEQIAFFGLEVELWRIGKSPVAPKFNVVSKPNNWTRSVRPASKSPYAEYWQAVTEQFNALDLVVRGRRFQATARHADNYLQVPIGDGDVHYEWQVRRKPKQVDVALHFESDDDAENFRWLTTLKRLSNEIGASVPWEFEAKKWGKGWAHARYVLPYNDARPSLDSVSEAVEAMRTLIERTWATVEQLRG
ncbi:MAG: DUF4268 domain-containing protein [Phycisphaerae bacterium]|nr:DUF4268 domain-containing protein [Phycisphaerae bacterium]